MIAHNFQIQNEPELIASVNLGSKDAFVEIYRTHFSGLCDFTFYITRDAEVAKELVQDMFLAIWEQRQNWSPHGSIRSYLYKAVKNRSLDHLNHQKVVRKYEKNNQHIEEDIRQQDDQVTQKELAAAIDREIERLPEKCRMIFVMSRQQGLTYNEIAEVQGVSIKTVETQIGRALKKLRTSLRHFL